MRFKAIMTLVLMAVLGMVVSHSRAGGDACTISWASGYPTITYDGTYWWLSVHGVYDDTDGVIDYVHVNWTNTTTQESGYFEATVSNPGYGLGTWSIAPRLMDAGFTYELQATVKYHDITGYYMGLPTTTVYRNSY